MSDMRNIYDEELQPKQKAAKSPFSSFYSSKNSFKRYFYDGIP